MGGFLVPRKVGPGELFSEPVADRATLHPGTPSEFHLCNALSGLVMHGPYEFTSHLFGAL